MTAHRRRKVAPPLDDKALAELALAYVGRFATTRAKLGGYLARKLRERGWAGAGEPDPGAVAERLAAQGFIDDSGYALSKSEALTARGYGARRVSQALRGAGVGREDSRAAIEHAEQEAAAAAMRFAQRRRIGPFARGELAIREREKAIAAMIRAGHGFAIARAIVGLEPGSTLDAAAIAAAVGQNGR